MEELRLFENNGVKLTDGSTESDVDIEDLYVDIEELYFTGAVNQTATPITKKDLKDFVEIHDYDSIGAVIKMIGIDEFWHKYGKPVTKK